MKQLIKGFLIGISSAIPGVCSALVAMSINAYQTLLEVIEKFYSLKVIFKHLMFLVGIVLGLITCIISMSLMFDNCEKFLKIFFLGLAIGGFLNLKRKIIEYKKVDFMIIMLGILLSLFPQVLSLNSTNNYSVVILIIGGCLSSLAFIMPGISGSLILLTLGIYQVVIDSISEVLQIFIKLPTEVSIINSTLFIISFVVGAVVFAKIIKNFIIKNEKLFLKFCLGLLIGTIAILFIEICEIRFNIILGIIICLSGIVVMKFFNE